jgi:hypothetical protein
MLEILQDTCDPVPLLSWPCAARALHSNSLPVLVGELRSELLWVAGGRECIWE